MWGRLAVFGSGRTLERALRENGAGDDNVDLVMSEVAASKDPIVGA